MNLNPIRLLDRGLDAVTKLPGAAVEVVKDTVGGFVPDSYVTAPKMPAYEKLPVGARAAAEARANGLSYPQKVSNKPGQKDGEPVTVVVSGTLDQLTETLEKAGWRKADKLHPLTSVRAMGTMLWHAVGGSKLKDVEYKRSPMSTLYIDGKAQVAGFSKNNDHHHVRDHIRIFDSGKRDEKGRPIYEITASRDTSLELKLPTMSSSHGIDTNLDPERDMLMADLLKGGVKDWKVAKGERTAEQDGLIRGKYRTDGAIYVASLPEA